MADSVVYGSVSGVDLRQPAGAGDARGRLRHRGRGSDREVRNDPVDMLFGVQLGGGTDINQSVGYCQGFIHDPRKTLFILITDLYEGGNAGPAGAADGGHGAAGRAGDVPARALGLGVPRATTRGSPASSRPSASPVSRARRAPSGTGGRGRFAARTSPGSPPRPHRPSSVIDPRACAFPRGGREADSPREGSRGVRLRSG